MAYRQTSKDTFEWKSIDHIIDNVKYAVLLLNHSMDHLSGHKSATFDKIWRKAERRVAVDGGSKYLRCPQEHPFPDILNGDFDSVQTERLEYFRRNGTKIMETPDQDYTDFQKAVKIVLHLNKRAVYENNNVDTNGTGSSNGGAVAAAAGEDRQRQACGAIIAIWSSLGRIDQVLSNINTLYSNDY
ncbi:unnamed protein product [Oppiella nova]|uniref:Thiamin pyrophosphokinase catalytic domain-containing protein n=1 Tax=Oppiella nova TaxID=334625 RepID=A0A7R9QRT2_9ACAR|nr:unnamed protein product [Oppiella nova]CAG2171566.1 unnamed protein product [Oppiella nova]